MLIASFLFTKSLNFYGSIGTVFKLQTFWLSAFLFKSFKAAGTLTNLLISNLSASAFKAIKSLLPAKLNIVTPVTSFDSF